MLAGSAVGKDRIGGASAGQGEIRVRTRLHPFGRRLDRVFSAVDRDQPLAVESLRLIGTIGVHPAHGETAVDQWRRFEPCRGAGGKARNQREAAGERCPVALEPLGEDATAALRVAVLDHERAAVEVDAQAENGAVRRKIPRAPAGRPGCIEHHHPMLVLAPLDVEGAPERGPPVHVGGEDLLSRTVHEEVPAAPFTHECDTRMRLSVGDELLLVGSPELHERPFEESAGQGDDAAVCSGGDATVESTRGVDQREAGVSIAAHEVRHHAVTISGGKAANTRCRIVLLGVRRHRSERSGRKPIAVIGHA